MLTLKAHGLRRWIEQNPDAPITFERVRQDVQDGRTAFLGARRELLAVGYLAVETRRVDGSWRHVTYVAESDGLETRPSTPQTTPDLRGSGSQTVGSSDGPTVSSLVLDLGSEVEVQEPHQEVSDARAREDVERICQHLSQRLADREVRHTVGAGWRRDARLMLDSDGRTEGQIHRMIDWCQDDSFWRGNVHSVTSLRAKYDQMRDRAMAEAQPVRVPQREGQIARLARLNANGSTPRELTA